MLVNPATSCLIDVAAASSSRCTSREPNWAGGFLLRGSALTAFHPLRGCAGKAWHFAHSVAGVMCCVLPRNWSLDLRFDLGAHATLLFSLPGRIIAVRG